MSYEIRSLTMLGSEVEPSEAIRWLREDFGALFDAISSGFGCEDASTRQDFGCLADELRTLVKACAESIATDQAIPIQVERGLPADQVDGTRALSRIIAQREPLEDELGPGAAHGFGLLSRLLVERLEGDAR